MLTGKRYGGLMADIWSCGIILFAMLCGYLPFQDPNTSALYKKIIAGDFMIPKFVSPSAKQFLKGLLITDPERRMNLSQIKEHSWFRMVNNNRFYKHLQVPLGINMNMYYVPVDDRVVGEMRIDQGIGIEQIKRMVSENEHNHIVTYYFLMLKKKLRNGGDSQYDICSVNFKRDVFREKFVDEKPVSVRRFRSKQRSERMNDYEQFTIPTESTTETRKSIKIGSPGRGAVFNKNNMFVNLSNVSNRNENRKKDESFEFRVDTNIVNIDTMSRMNEKKRKMNLNSKNKKESICNPYEVEERFRNKINFGVNYQTLGVKNVGGVSQRTNGSRIPMTFRSSMGRYESRQRKPRNISLQICNNDPQNGIKDSKIQRQKLNRTFVGRKSKKSVRKWCDQKERMKQMMNKTVIGFGNQTHRFNISHI